MLYAYHELSGTKNCQVCDTKSTTWCSWSISHDVICKPRTARYVVRNQAETAEDAESTSEHQRIQQYGIFWFNFWRRKNCTVWWWYQELHVMCYELKHKITAWYVVRSQAETAEDAESTSELQCIQQYAIFRFNFWRRKNCTVWYALKMIPGTARYVIRNQPHDVHDRTHMM